MTAGLRGAITGTASGNTCARHAGTDAQHRALPAVPAVGTPVRCYETMELSLYANGGKSWLGMRSVSAGGALQPLLGPLADTDGLGFTYLDSTGAGRRRRQHVKSIVVPIRGVTSQQVSTSGGNTYNAYVQDSLVTQVSLRNALR